jgi:lipid A 3-O-deacylase
MKPVCIILFSGLLFYGCSRHSIDSVSPVIQQVNLTKAAGPENISTSRPAREFPVESISTSVHNGVTNPVTDNSPRISGITDPVNRKNIILELPEDESQNRHINIAGNQNVIIQRLKSERKFSLTFENDIFDMTDRYFTNGVRFEWTGPGLANSPLSRLLIEYGHPATNTYSAYLVQNMYTPVSTKIPPLLSGNDRPYAAYMILGHRKETLDATRQLKLTNDISFGVIGPYSLGSAMQQGVHHSLPTNDPPLGWETQIKNDIVAGYRFQVEKTVAGNECFQIGALAAAEAGTLYDNLMMGFRMESGKNTSPDNNPGREIQGKEKVKLHAYLQGESRFIGYDATLQGGMFNRNNTYILQSDQIKHIVLKAEAGVSVRYLQYGVELGQTLISPEYSGGKNHKWGRVTLNFYFR